MARSLPDYDELEIGLSPGRNDAYNVEIESATGARGRGTFVAPSEAEIARFRHTVDPRNRRVPGPTHYLDDAKRFGASLFDQLLASPGVRNVYTTARHDASAAERGVRVTLSLRATPELANIPWEFLYDRPRFLAQHVSSPVVRFVDLEDPPPPLRINSPLRILGMVSRPRSDELAVLDAEQEQAALELRLRPLIDAGLVTVRWLPRATLSALREEVDHGKEFHVFHYIGHGEYDEGTCRSSLILETSDRRPCPVGGQQLGGILCDRGSLRLALLNACEAAQTAPQDPLAGIATSLMEFGVPAVAAMQFAITDAGALTFADEFYRALAAGFAVDAAVTQARRALAADSDVEWATPVLFMRVLDGRLFSLGTAPTDAAVGLVSPPSARDQANGDGREPDGAFRRLVDSLTDYAVIMLDRSGTVLSWNLGATRMLGYDAGQILGENFARLYGGDATAADYPDPQLEAAALTGRYEGKDWLVSDGRDGSSKFWAQIAIVRLDSDEDEDDVDRFALVVRDITAEKQVVDRLDSALATCKRNAQIDRLTGLWNRGAWDEALGREMSRAQRHGFPLSVGIIDLDHFKRINDEFGHLTGDSVLQRMSRAWKDALRPSDVLARYGGEEFGLVLPDCNLDHAQVAAERLRQCAPRIRSLPLPITCSAGVAQWDGHEPSEKLVDRADAALYRAKDRGRDRIERAPQSRDNQSPAANQG
jgi:diguanylate cyclase (GGDEF)-like protein/PAS domain S-box-containing protein